MEVKSASLRFKTKFWINVVQVSLKEAKKNSLFVFLILMEYFVLRILVCILRNTNCEVLRWNIANIYVKSLFQWKVIGKKNPWVFKLLQQHKTCGKHMFRLIYHGTINREVSDVFTANSLNMTLTYSQIHKEISLATRKTRHSTSDGTVPNMKQHKEAKTTEIDPTGTVASFPRYLWQLACWEPKNIVWRLGY